MRELVFVGFSMLSLSVISGNVHGMYHFLNDRENLNESSDQIRRQDFDKPREEIIGRPTCIGGSYDEYQSTITSCEYMAVSMIRRCGDLVRGIKELENENSKLREERQNSDKESVRSSEYNVSYSKFDAITVLRDICDRTVGNLTSDIAELSGQFEKLKAENCDLKKEKAGNSASSD